MCSSDLLRRFPAIFNLAYWDIFKNYHANKQEENAYYIGTNTNITRIENTTASWDATNPNDINREVNYNDNIVITYVTDFRIASATVKIRLQEQIVTKNLSDVITR